MPYVDRSRRSMIVLATVLALTACEADITAPALSEPVSEPVSETGSLVAANPDGSGHPNVGLLAFDLDAGGPLPPFALCTGFVVSDDVFLTAAHCIQSVAAPAWSVTLEPGSPNSPVMSTGIFPDDFPFPVVVPTTYADAVIVHPNFGEGHPRANDVAVLVFPEGTFSGIIPADLPDEGQLDALAAQGGLLGQEFTLVGYGTTLLEGDGERRQVPGYRQVTTAPFQGLTRDWLNLQMTLTATGEGGTCTGDSGGPHFLGTSNTAVALLGGPGGAQGCGKGTTRTLRLDTPAVQDFLRTFVDLQ